MPGQLLHKQVPQATSLQRLPPVAADQLMGLHPTRGPRPASQSTNHIIHLRQLSIAHPRWYHTPYMCHPRLYTPCPLCKEMQRPLRPPGKVAVSTAPPTKPPLGDSRWSTDRSDRTARAEPPSTPILWEQQPQHRLQQLQHCVPSLLSRTDQRCCRCPHKKQLDLQTLHNDSATTSARTVADQQVRLLTCHPS